MEENIPIPGLTAGCQEEEPSFQLWEKRERGGALKEMFFWKVRSVTVPPPRQQPGRKENKEKPPKPSDETKPTVKKTCQIGIGRTVYKLLTKQRKQKTNMNRTEDNKKEKVGWRGPREEPSEIAARRRIFSKNNLVISFTTFPSIQPIHLMLANVCG